MGLNLSEIEAERYFQRQEMLLEFSRLFDYKEASDRAIAIVGPAFLDTLLSDILTEFMVDDVREVNELLKTDGALGSWGNRVRVCYCLGLIDKIVTADLKLVGKIRNRFAHDIRADFSAPEISQWCHKLQWHNIQLWRCNPQVIAGTAPGLVPQFLPEMKEAVQQKTLSRNAQTYKNHSGHVALHLPPYPLRPIDHGFHRTSRTLNDA